MTALLGSRFTAAGLLLVALVFLELLVPALFPLIVAAVLIVLPPFHWATVLFFGRRAMAAPDVPVLGTRTQDAFMLALVSTTAAFLGLLVVLRAFERIGPVPREVFLIGVAYCLLLVAGPAFNWIVTWWPWRRGDAVPLRVRDEP